MLAAKGPRRLKVGKRADVVSLGSSGCKCCRPKVRAKDGTKKMLKVNLVVAKPRACVLISRGNINAGDVY